MRENQSLLERVYQRAPALQHRDFRLLWVGQLISMIGSQMQLLAIDWHVFHLLQDVTYTLSLFGRQIPLDGSALGLGGLGLIRVVPIVCFALVGGMVADSRDRRRVMIVTQSVAALLALTLALISLTGNASLAVLYLLSAGVTATAAFDNPARQSLIPNLVPRDHLTNAVSLNTLLWQIGTIVGPAIAGILIVRFNIGLIYGINSLTFLAVLVALLRMSYRGGPATNESGVGWDSLVEGLRFVRGSRIIWGTMLLDFFATFFSSARTMLPIVAVDVLHVGADGYGLLATAQSVGAVLAGLLTTLRGEIQRQGYVLLISVAIYGAATALFGVTSVFALSYIFLALTGASDTVSTVIRGTIRQLMTPDRLRGRMTSVNMIFFMGGPQLGELEAGVVASLFGAPIAIFTGGIATIFLTGWVAWKYPRLREYTRETGVALQAAAAD